MRVPVSWLREFVDAPASITPDELHAALVRVGLEEEGLHTFGLEGPIVVGEVLEFVDEPQSNGKTIRWCQVDVCPGDARGIVCGAHNFFVGDKVVVTLPGAVLPGPFPIAARKTYGHVSDGMIASARELGLGDEHDGILRLAELGLDPEVGADAIALLGLDDWAVEVNVTPDRGYALSIRGIAREYSHATGAEFRDPADASRWSSGASQGDTRIETANAISVILDDRAPIRGHEGCSQFVTRIVRDVDPSRHTPAWMISRLGLAGIRSISLLVDISNYVMVELGQPLHSYDLDTIRGSITVRRAAPGEKLTTLDGQERALDPEDLLITDEEGPIGLAGVMGGERTESTSSTRNVLIEAANFDPITIARSARRHRLPSEASRRFERGVDPAVAVAAASRAVDLLVELAGGTADAAIGRVGTVEDRSPIVLPADYVNAIVGADFTRQEAVDALTAIGAVVTEAADGDLVKPPTWRPDLRDRADLAEEVARIVGYDRIPAVLPTAPPGRGLTREQSLRRSVSTMLASTGATEVMAYPFVSEEQLGLFGERVPAVELSNPMDGAAPYLRTSLLPGLVTVAQRNLSRGLTDLAIFELGVVYLPGAAIVSRDAALPSGTQRPSDAVLEDLEASIPAQPLRVAALFTGDVIRKQPGLAASGASLADALTAAEQVATAVGASLDVRAATSHGLHPGRTAGLYLGDEEVGIAGELVPALAHELDLPRRAAVMEIDLSRLMEHAPRDVSSHPIATLPAATQDVSLVVDASIPAADVLGAVTEGAGALLEHAELVDDYRGPGVDSGMKSLTFALRFRAPDRTLTAAEATEAKLAGVASAAAKWGAFLRE
ncbi:phenylalanyl-tRNA synthetase beta chain [Cryobacterium mesophilum]|uniref:Phenylalanine--tRNA ligase beta subunit n=1 Tax=Terrimesophilobacter mesophilus TaxID=433647 RepID=A0A4R8V8H9_9MICO|nr:phenylalanine--tRNA ligase subunit beta [Terrimesophilobacter mesophilus]MBB5632123.1 phenylalanyl-tRNA synthetase beta chain [Terrimesophilobacter mesophilus]TFB78993.1 phenylalanine--tRNA ligase subunit beta [Terrimesophilobacter mesophilus]